MLLAWKYFEKICKIHMFVKSLTGIQCNYQNLPTNYKLLKSRHLQHNFYFMSIQSIIITESTCLDYSSSSPGPLITIQSTNTITFSVLNNWDIIIIIIIIFHQWDLNRPASASSNRLFQVAFVHSVYNSALFLPSCWLSFLLHVVANLICIFSFSHQLVIMSALP